MKGPGPNGLWEAAVSVLTGNDAGGFVKPGPRQYPGQWNWDAALITIGLAHVDPERARTEVRSLLSGQWDDGMVPHIVFHHAEVDYFPGPSVWATGAPRSPRVPTSGITQPPLLATAVRVLHEVSPSPEFLEEVVPALERWHRWFQSRRVGGDALVAIVHPWESGMDNSPRFDRALTGVARAPAGFVRRDLVHVPAEERPTDVEYAAYVSILEALRACNYRPSLAEAPFVFGDVSLTSVLIRAEEDLVFLNTELGGSGAEARARADSLSAALERAWDPAEGLFRDLGSGNEPATIAGVLPLIAAPDRSRSDRLVAALADPSRFGPRADAPWHPTSVAKDDPSFDHRCYWRGPVWVNVNWLLIRGLEKAGYVDQAERLWSHSLALVAEHGFWEYYDPRDGQGLGSDRFSWTAAVVLDLLRRPVSSPS